jgi:hypothetical protein
MTVDPEVLTFNLAFGFMLSYTWDGENGSIDDDPWLGLVGKVQRTLGPYYAGRRLVSFRRLEGGLSETVFEGGYSVVANWSPSKTADVDGATIAPLGFLARTSDGTVLAATYGTTWNWVTFPGSAR